MKQGPSGPTHRCSYCGGYNRGYCKACRSSANVRPINDFKRCESKSKEESR